MTEYLRMSGIYWGLTVMDLMNSLDKMDKDEVIEFVKSCQHDCGGIGASIGHDPHLLYTLSAIQVGNGFDSILSVLKKIIQYRFLLCTSHQETVAMRHKLQGEPKLKSY